METRIGKVSFINETEKLKPTFYKKVIGLEVQGYQPQILPIEFINDRIKQADQLKVGDDVRVHFIIGASQWENREGKTNHSVYLRAQKVEVFGRHKTESAMSETGTAKDETAGTTTPQTPMDELFKNI